MSSFFSFFSDLLTSLWNFLVDIPVIVNSYVSISYGYIILAFIVLFFIASLFWKGARR